MGVYFYVLYEKNSNIFFFILSILISCLHILLHGPMVLILINLIFVYYLSNFINILNKNYKTLYSFILFNIFLLIIVSFAIINNISIEIPYLGKLTNFVNILEILQKHFNDTAYGRTAYPDLLYPKNLFYILILTPVRFIYFLCGPFIGTTLLDYYIVLEGCIYGYLLFILLINFKIIIKNKYIIYLLLLIFPLILYYSWGVNNYGTAIRHKIKFLPIILVIVSPLIYSNFNRLIKIK